MNKISHKCGRYYCDEWCRDYESNCKIFNDRRKCRKSMKNRKNSRSANKKRSSSFYYF